MKKTHITLFASGNGSNVENIILYFKEKPNITLSCISNNPKAGVIQRCNNLNISCQIINKSTLNNPTEILSILNKSNLIVLAGFLLKIPEFITQKFPNKIVNIHPSLLPKYGGKGMYGNNVHLAVIENNETESGITIHYVNEHYDKGTIICQKKCGVSTNDTPESLAKKIHLLEMKYFPETIEKIISNIQM